MRNLLPIIIPVMLLGACDRQEPARRGSSSPAADAQPSGSSTPDTAKRTDAHWVLQPSAESTVLVLQTQTGSPILSLTCSSGKNRLQVNVPGFTPIGSEDRLSFGSGGEVEALVAEFHGDRRLGGVSAAGAVPANLAALMGGPVSASYGSQTSGPTLPHPRRLSRRSSPPVAARHLQLRRTRDCQTVRSAPASFRTAGNFRVSPCAQSEPNRSGPRGSKGAASLIPNRRTRKARASGPGSRPHCRVACGGARLTGGRSNYRPVPRPAVPTACRTRATLWRSSFWSKASAGKVALNRCKAGRCQIG